MTDVILPNVEKGIPLHPSRFLARYYQCGDRTKFICTMDSGDSFLVHSHSEMMNWVQAINQTGFTAKRRQQTENTWRVWKFDDG